MLVRNQLRGDDFSVLEQSGEQARAIGLGAQVVSIKHLHDGVIKDRRRQQQLLEGQERRQDGSAGLGLMDRQRVKMWLRDIYREIDDVGV